MEKKDFLKIELEKVDEYNCYKVIINNNCLAKLVETCEACPEQYDLISLLDNKQIAYFRLRFGSFRVDVPSCGGETIYYKAFEDCFKGAFKEEEREEELITAIKVVIKNLRMESDYEEE